MAAPSEPTDGSITEITDTVLYQDGNEPQSGWQKGFQSGGTLQKESNSLFISVGASEAAEEAAFEHPIDTISQIKSGDILTLVFSSSNAQGLRYAGAIPNLGDQPSLNTSTIDAPLKPVSSENAVAVAARDTDSKSEEATDISVTNVEVKAGGVEVRTYGVLSIDPIFDIVSGVNGEHVYVASNSGEDQRTVDKVSLPDLSIVDSITASRTEVGNSRGASAPPDGGSLYFAKGQIIYKHDSSGSEEWGFNLNNDVESVRGGSDSSHVYAGSAGGTLFKVNDSDGSSEWSNFIGDNVVFISEGPNGNYVYAWVGDGTNELKKVDASDGSIIWSVGVSLDGVAAGPNADFLFTITQSGKVQKRDSSDGSVISEVLSGDSTRQSLAVDSNGLVFTANGSNLEVLLTSFK